MHFTVRRGHRDAQQITSLQRSAPVDGEASPPRRVRAVCTDFLVDYLPFCVRR
jgi:hypothetical protein